MKAAEFYDEGDHPLLNMHRDPFVVLFIRSPTGEVSKWEGRAELIPHYHAKRVQETE